VEKVSESTIGVEKSIFTKLNPRLPEESDNRIPLTGK
jgi:hypothetical protein